MNGQAKIELMLELKNKIQTGLNNAKQETTKSVNEMQKKMNSLKYDFAKNSKELVSEIPALGTAFRLATNPMALTAAGLLAIGKGIDYTTQKAADFNTQFRTLANLNLDKSKGEIDTLKRMVMDASFDKGFDTGKTVLGFFDIQSATGKYGNEVKNIVKKQGEFSMLMQADFNEYIAGTAKAMANFGFGEKQLDSFNRSAYATVKVGVTTFDQLAKVQSVYAGASAANGQTFDTANKMLSLFTVKTKSVDEAATLTKSMFNDLTKKSTIDAFKKVGLSVYDSSGKIKQADLLMLELNKKFRGISTDSGVVKLKNQFAGSEGLIAMIQAATDKTGQLQTTFDAFNATKLNMDKAIELAKNDLNYKTEVMRNKLNVMEIQIGESLLPLKVKIAELKVAAIDLVNALYLGREGERTKGASSVNNKYMPLLGEVKYMDKKTYDKHLKDIDKDLSNTRNSFTKSQSTPQRWGNAFALALAGEFKAAYAFTKMPTQSTYAGALTQLTDFKHLFTNQWKRETNSGKNVATKKTALPPAGSTGAGGSTRGGSTIGDGVDTITGSARQIRNLTVNIEAFNKGGINTQNTSLQHMEPSKIEEWFTDMCMRVVRSIETTY